MRLLKTHDLTHGSIIGDDGSADREKGQRNRDRFEKLLRKNPGEYWKPENQRAFHDAIRRSIGEESREAPVSTPPATAPALAPVAPPRPRRRVGAPCSTDA